MCSICIFQGVMFGHVCRLSTKSYVELEETNRFSTVWIWYWNWKDQWQEYGIVRIHRFRLKFKI